MNRIKTVCIEDHEEDDFYTYYNIDYSIMNTPEITDYYKKNQIIKEQSKNIIKKKKSRKRSKRKAFRSKSKKFYKI